MNVAVPAKLTPLLSGGIVFARAPLRNYLSPSNTRRRMQHAVYEKVIIIDFCAVDLNILVDTSLQCVQKFRRVLQTRIFYIYAFII